MGEKKEMIPLQERERIAKILNELLKGGCPRCGHPQFALIDGYVNLMLSPNVGQTTLGGQTIPCVVLNCQKCGFISLHATNVLMSSAEAPKNE